MIASSGAVHIIFRKAADNGEPEPGCSFRHCRGTYGLEENALFHKALLHGECHRVGSDNNGNYRPPAVLQIEAGFTEVLPHIIDILPQGLLIGYVLSDKCQCSLEAARAAGGKAVVYMKVRARLMRNSMKTGSESTKAP